MFRLQPRELLCVEQNEDTDLKFKNWLPFYSFRLHLYESRTKIKEIDDSRIDAEALQHDYSQAFNAKLLLREAAVRDNCSKTN